MRKLLLTLFAFAILFSCNEDDRPKNTTILDGIWKLDSFVGEDTPAVVFGQIRWDFDLDSGTVNITDNSSQNHSPIPEGTYGFTYIAPTEQDGTGDLLIDGIYEYTVDFEANALILAPGGTGDPMIFFR